MRLSTAALALLAGSCVQDLDLRTGTAADFGIGPDTAPADVRDAATEERVDAGTVDGGTMDGGGNSDAGELACVTAGGECVRVSGEMPGCPEGRRQVELTCYTEGEGGDDSGGEGGDEGDVLVCCMS